MKTLFFIFTLAFSTLTLANNSNLENEIDHLYQSGKITEGEYSVLMHLSNLQQQKIKTKTKHELVYEQMAKIEKLKRSGKITEGEYSVLVEMYKDALKAVEIK